METTIEWHKVSEVTPPEEKRLISFCFGDLVVCQLIKGNWWIDGELDDGEWEPDVWALCPGHPLTKSSK